MSQSRRTAVIAGCLYFVTHVTSIAAVVLYGGSAFDPFAALGSRAAVLTGGLLEVVLALAVVGTAVALFPLLRTSAPGLAVSYVALRTLEASVILAGVVVLLPVVGRPATTTAPGLSPEDIDSLRLIHDWTFLVGPGLIVPVHTVLLATLLWRHGLVPRFVPVLGFVGGPIIAIMNVGVLYGAFTVQPLLTLPIWAWEVSLAIVLISRGIRPAPRASSPQTPLDTQTRPVGAAA